MEDLSKWVNANRGRLVEIGESSGMVPAAFADQRWDGALVAQFRLYQVADHLGIVNVTAFDRQIDVMLDSQFEDLLAEIGLEGQVMFAVAEDVLAMSLLLSNPQARFKEVISPHLQWRPVIQLGLQTCLAA